MYYNESAMSIHGQFTFYDFVNRSKCSYCESSSSASSSSVPSDFAAAAVAFFFFNLFDTWSLTKAVRPMLIWNKYKIICYNTSGTFFTVLYLGTMFLEVLRKQVVWGSRITNCHLYFKIVQIYNIKSVDMHASRGALELPRREPVLVLLEVH